VHRSALRRSLSSADCTWMCAPETPFSSCGTGVAVEGGKHFSAGRSHTHPPAVAGHGSYSGRVNHAPVATPSRPSVGRPCSRAPHDTDQHTHTHRQAERGPVQETRRGDAHAAPWGPALALGAQAARRRRRVPRRAKHTSRTRPAGSMHMRGTRARSARHQAAHARRLSRTCECAQTDRKRQGE
jgi:hypothetical protein